MAASNVCWGIEIGAAAIKALKLEAEGDGINVLDFAIIPHPQVLSTPDLDVSDALRVSLGTLASQVDLSKAQIAISIPGHQGFARFAKLPPVEAKRVPDIVKFEAVQQIPFPLEEVEWDFQTFISPDSPEVEVGIFAVTRQRIMERLAQLGDVGITPDIATLSPISAYNAVAYDLDFTERTAGTIILDIGTTATDMIVADAGRVWVRTFPIGGHQFTDAVVQAFKVTYPKAERVKRDSESTKHARQVFQAMRPVFSDLVQEVQRSIGYYGSIHPEAKLERLIGLGSTFRLPGLRKYLKQQLQMEVYRLEQFKKLSVDGPRAGEFQEASLNLATAYGLALQGLDIAPLRPNLMPVPVVREAIWRRKAPWFGVAAGVAAAGAGLMFVGPLLTQTQIQGATPDPIIATVAREAQRQKAEAEAAGVLSAEGADTDAARLASLTKGRELYAYLVNDLGLMLADARQRAGSAAPGPVFSVVSYATEYKPGQPSAEDTASDPYAAGRGGAASGITDPNEMAIADQERIRVTATLETTAADPQGLVLDTIEAWLRQNERRDGVPYRIVPADPPTRTQTIDASGRAGGVSPGGGARPGGSPGPRPAGGGGGRSTRAVGGLPGSGGGSASPQSATPRPAGGSPGSATGGRSELGPLEPLEPRPQPTARIDLTYFVVLNPEPPAAETDAAAEQATDGGQP